jgi:hypothetical protein
MFKHKTDLVHHELLNRYFNRQNSPSSSNATLCLTNGPRTDSTRKVMANQHLVANIRNFMKTGGEKKKKNNKNKFSIGTMH